MANKMFLTRTMMGVINNSVSANSFLRDRYFGNVKTFETALIEFDVKSGKRRLAPFVHPKIGGKTVEGAGFQVQTFEAPEVSPDMITTAEDLLHRSPGESIYSTRSPDERAREKLGEDLGELDEMITRREELMCAQALFSGEIEVKGDGYDQVIRFWPQNAADQPFTQLAGQAAWDQASADPFQDLATAASSIRQASGINATEAIMGAAAANAFLAKLKDYEVELNWKAVEMGRIDPRELPDGVTFIGTLSRPGAFLDLYTYDEWYLPEGSDVEASMVPANRVLVGSPRVPTTMAYGLVSLMKEEGKMFHEGRRVPDSWAQRKNPAGRIVQIKSKPLPIINQVRGFHVLEVL